MAASPFSRPPGAAPPCASSPSSPSSSCSSSPLAAAPLRRGRESGDSPAHLVLLVLLPVRDGPGELGGAQAVVVERLALLGQEQELLGVHAHEQDPLAGVNPQAAEAAHGRLEHHFRRPARAFDKGTGPRPRAPRRLALYCGAPESPGARAGSRRSGFRSAGQTHAPSTPPRGRVVAAACSRSRCSRRSPQVGPAALQREQHAPAVRGTCGRWGKARRGRTGSGGAAFATRHGVRACPAVSSSASA